MDLDQWDDRPTDVRPLSVAAGYDYRDSPLGVRVYDLAPGEQSALRYHYHDEEVKAFSVLEGTVHVEIPDEKYIVEPNWVLFVDPESPQRAYNPDDANTAIRILAIDRGHAHLRPDWRRLTPS